MNYFTTMKECVSMNLQFANGYVAKIVDMSTHYGKKFEDVKEITVYNAKEAIEVIQTDNDLQLIAVLQEISSLPSIVRLVG